MPVQFYREGVSEGGLFQNDRRQHDRSPDVNGKCLLTIQDCEALLQQAKEEGGATLWLSGWNKSGQKGPWVSLSPKAAYNSQRSNGGGGQQGGGQQGGGQQGGGGYDNRGQGGGGQQGGGQQGGGGYDNRGQGGGQQNDQGGNQRNRDLDDEIPFN